MVKVYSIDGLTPVVDPTAYVHPSAVLVGDVVVGRGCYVGPCASLRGDFGRIILEEGANLQDTCVMHGFPEHDTLVEQDGHVGHGAVLHGCRVKRNAMVGINAVVMDNAVIGESSVVAACAFVKAGMIVPERVLVAGVPGKVLRELTEQEIAWKAGGTRTYQDLAMRSLRSMKLTEALPAVEPDRQRIKVPSIKPLVELKTRGANQG